METLISSLLPVGIIFYCLYLGCAFFKAKGIKYID